MRTDDVSAHRMHAERGEITPAAAAAINVTRAAGGRVVAVGTTSLRLLESAAAPDGTIRPFAGETELFILPGYRFRTVDRLMTNFHLPRSTLLMLVSAFVGTDPMRAAYAHAIATGYRFYSYGDACLLERVYPHGAGMASLLQHPEGWDRHRDHRGEQSSVRNFRISMTRVSVFVGSYGGSMPRGGPEQVSANDRMIHTA